MNLHTKHLIRNLPYQMLSKFKNFDPYCAISLFCDPRGGSTWLAETLNTIVNSSIIDEPLHVSNMKPLQEMNFSWRQYIPEHEKWPAARKYLESVLSGKNLNKTNCHRNSFLEIILSQQLILKIIRGKALLPWYVKQYNFKYKPLFVVRHPYAVAASQLNHSAWNYDFELFKIPSSPFNEFYEPHISFLRSLKSKEEQLTALWCMTNNIVLQHKSNNQSWISMNYENLVLEPKRYFEKIFGIWDLEIPKSLYLKIQKPSTTTVGKTKINPELLLTDWQQKLSSTQIDQLQNVLNYFGVSYYNHEVLPVISADKVHLNNLTR